MFRLTLSNHPEVCKDLTCLLSGLLPHKNKGLDHYATLLDKVTRLIKVEEMEVEFYLVYKVAQQILEISMDTGTPPVLSRTILESILDSELYATVVKDGRGFARMCEMEGVPSDFNIESNVQLAATLAKQKSLALYDEAFDMALTPGEMVDDTDVVDGVMGYLVSLKNNYSIAVGTEFVSMQVAFLNGEKSVVQSRKREGWYEFFRASKYKALEGWVEFGNYFFSMLSDRLNNAAEESKPMSSVHQAELLKEDLMKRSEVLATYGIPPIDVGTPIRKTRYSVLIGKPNLGKTTIAMNWAVNVLLEGKKVAIYSGENPESSIFYKYIVPAYIYKKYNFFVTYEQVMGFEEMGGTTTEEVEDRKMMLKLAIAELAESENLMYIQSLDPYSMKDKLLAIREKFEFDYLVIDHALSVTGTSGPNGENGGSHTELLERMSRDLIEFRDKYQASICLLSHPSPDAKKIVSREGAEGLVKYCKQIEADADDIFYIFDTEELEAKKLIAMIQTKGRDAAKVLDTIYLTNLFQYKVFRYDEAVQPASILSEDTVDSIPLGDDGDEIVSHLDDTFIEF